MLRANSKSIFFIVFLKVFFLFPNLIHASSEIGTLDTVHYIPPIYAKSGLSSTGDVRDHYLQLSTLETTPFNITITNASGSINETVSISKSSPQNVTLSAAPYGTGSYGALNIVTNTGANTVNNEDGLVLTASQKFYANIRHSSNSQGGSLVAKGRTALGKRFRSGHVHTNTQQLDKKSHFISVMAISNNTTVNFSDISPGFTFIGATPSSVTLNQYESFVVAVELDDSTNSTVANDLNGTLVTSDKMIVMNSGSFLAGHSTTTGGGRDIGVDQVVPVDYLGTRFIPVIGGGGGNAANIEVPIVVADTDNTAIFINGSSTAEATINAGEYYLVSGTHYSNGSMFIRTSHPAYVYQSTSSNTSNGQAMNFVAAIFDNLENQSLLVPSVDQLGTPTISIIAPSTASVTLDGSVLTGGLAVPGTAAFLLYIVTGETGDVEVTSTEPFSYTMTSAAGARGASAYYTGFPNSYAIDDNTTTQALTAVVIDVQANDVSGNNTFTVENTLVSSPSNGLAVVNVNGTITYTPTSGFTSDTFTYRINNSLGLTDDATVTITLDTDGDGVADTNDIDSDNDGIPDSVENANSPVSNDTDGDGIEDKLDLDSDNDGIFDVVEAGHGQSDSNNNGRIDTSVFFGDNGFADVLETVSESGIANYTVTSTDTDGLENYIDLDSDGDGLPDNIEAQTTTSYISPNVNYNKDGLDTAYTSGLSPINTVGATAADYLNTNSDSQGGNDTSEAGLTLAGNIGDNGLDNAIDTTDDYSDVNGTLNDPTTLPDEDSDNLPDVRDSSGLTPSDLQIDGANIDSVPENTGSGNAVGTLSTTDADSGDTFTYSLIAGTGNEDNSSFSISGNTVNLAFTPDFENPKDLGDTAGNNTYSIRVRTTDSFGLTYDEVLLISVTDVDEIQPTVQIQNVPSDTNSAFTTTFEFSENVNNFVASDITVSNSTVSNFSVIDGNTYTALITPTTEGNVTIDVSASVANDDAGNNNSAAAQTISNFDTSRPTVQIQNVPTDTNSTFTATFEFSENVNNFVASDITVGNGTASNFSVVDGNTYTALITPTTEGNVTIDVLANAASDKAGNTNTAANQSIANFDTAAPSAPTVVIIEDSNNDAEISSAELSGNIDVRIDLPTDAAAGDIVNAIDGNGNSTTITVTASDLGNSLTTSFPSPGDGGSLNASASLTDLAGNLGASGSDAATLDLSSADTPIVTVTEDVDNNGFIGISELSGNVNVSITLPSNASANDTLTVTDGNGNTDTITVTAMDLGGSITTSFVSPGDGNSINATATLTDTAGNISPIGQDGATLDLTAPTAPAVTITEDTNNNGEISDTELTGNINVLITLPTGVNTNETLTINSSSGTLNIVLSAAHISRGTVTTSFIALSSGETFAVSAAIRDLAGNTGANGSDSALINLDSDGDGISNDDEAALGTDPDQTDSDGDGIPDLTEIQNVSTPLDSDRDGVIDALDPDDDNDGIATRDEYLGNADGNPATNPSDYDGDGIADYLDTDSDADGIPDAIENNASTSDIDNDGIVDSLDADDDGTPGVDTGRSDANGDGVEDNYVLVDTDADLKPDYLDVDSDNDGLADALEAGLSFRDSDNDGIDDTVDADDDGSPGTDAGLTDANGDGIIDNFTPLDSDDDGIPNYRDLDSDNDSIPDVIEGGLSDNDNNSLVDDNTVVSTVPDTDGSDGPDYIDLDSDGDGFNDIFEIGNGDLDRHGDGRVDNITDVDQDGIPDLVDGNTSGRANQLDSDGDGVPNITDTDDDNDGIPDTVETQKLPVLTGNDIDGDGIDNAIDVNQTGGTDANGDGIDDALDGDSDDDGIPDSRDPDADNDGIPDILEVGNNPNQPLDSDKDGTPDYQDTDSDNDNIPDSVEYSNVPPLIGTDGDNDGIDDALDADISGGDDINNNGIDDAFEATDTDNDGNFDHRDGDADNDSVPDLLEGSGDTDNDGIANYRDSDSDNDGIPDVIEASNVPALANNDADNDGVDDALDVDLTGGLDINNNDVDDALEPSDSDADGLPDMIDTDSDGDGVPDVIEAPDMRIILSMILLSGLDSDSDGIDDFIDVDQTGGNDVNGDGIDDSAAPIDSDKDGIPNYADTDSDNDGILDGTEVGISGIDTDNDGIDDRFDVDQTGGEDMNNDGVDDTVMPLNTDNDATPDYLDLDSDNDGLNDVIEAGLPDTNSDGLADGGATTEHPLNSDDDESPDYRDTDKNNNGKSDLFESGNGDFDENNDGQIDDMIDTDNDGIPDVIDNELGQFGASLDTDGDGVPNSLDLDDDNDGIPDAIEAMNVPELSGIDINNNGVDDAIDVSITGGRDNNNDGIDDLLSGDTDGDGINDILDRDSDNDGIVDSLESGNPNIVDVNRDGEVDDFIDTNKDGLDDRIETHTLVINSDNDNIPDFQDWDSDNDGITDLLESGSPSHLDSDTNGVIDTFVDLDGDGIADAIDGAIEGHAPGTSPSIRDTDGDGIKDFRDLDSDGDGFDDALEAGDFDGDGVADNLENKGELETAISGTGSTDLFFVLALILVALTRLQKIQSIQSKTLNLTSLAFLVGLVGLSSVPQANAASDRCGIKDKDVFEKCWYIGAGLGVSHVDPEGSVNGWSTNDNSSSGFNLHLGRHFNPRWYWEFSYVDSGEAGLGNRNPALNQAIPDAAITYQVPSLIAGYYFREQTHRWNLYATTGISLIQTEATDTRIGETKQSTAQLAFGIGAQYRFTDSHWFAKLQLDSFDRDARFISLRISRYLDSTDTARTVKPTSISLEPTP